MNWQQMELRGSGGGSDLRNRVLSGKVSNGGAFLTALSTWLTAVRNTSSIVIADGFKL